MPDGDFLLTLVSSIYHLPAGYVEINQRGEARCYVSNTEYGAGLGVYGAKVEQNVLRQLLSDFRRLEKAAAASTDLDPDEELFGRLRESGEQRMVLLNPSRPAELGRTAGALTAIITEAMSSPINVVSVSSTVQKVNAALVVHVELASIGKESVQVTNPLLGRRDARRLVYWVSGPNDKNLGMAQHPLLKERCTKFEVPKDQVTADNLDLPPGYVARFQYTIPINAWEPGTHTVQVGYHFSAPVVGHFIGAKKPVEVE